MVLSDFWYQVCDAVDSKEQELSIVLVHLVDILDGHYLNYDLKQFAVYFRLSRQIIAQLTQDEEDVFGDQEFLLLL